LLQPRHLRFQRLAALVEGTEYRSPDGRQVSQPMPLFVGLHMTGSADPGSAEGGEVECLAVDAPDRPVPFDDQVHDASFGVVGRRIRLRGRSTIMPSSADWTRDNSEATCC